MKIQFKFILTALLMAGLLILGCQQAGDESVRNESTGQDGNAEVNEDESLTTDELLSLQDRLTEIVNSDDLSRCEELEVKQYFVSCETYLLSNRAENAEDTGVCNSASTDDIKTRCIAEVERKFE